MYGVLPFKISLVSLLVLLNFQLGTSIRCYTCQSHGEMDRECSLGKPTLPIEDCNDPKGVCFQGLYTATISTERVVDIRNEKVLTANLTLTLRGCGTQAALCSDFQRSQEKLFGRLVALPKVHECSYCTEDLCNAAPESSVFRNIALLVWLPLMTLRFA